MSRRPSALLSLIAKVPHPGTVKTRLIPALGAQGAAVLHEQMARHVIGQMRLADALMRVPADPDTALRCRLEVCVAGGSPAQARRLWHLPATAQVDGDLGARMQAVCARGFAQGHDVVAVLGADCPELTSTAIATAVQTARATSGAAMITSADGGYGLLALARSAAPVLDRLFSPIAWSTDTVARAQRERLAQAGIACTVTGWGADVDEPADLPIWEAVRTAWYEPPARISVIIPTYNEEDGLGSCVAAARRYLAQAQPTWPVEFIVTDGGSTDATPALARALGCTVVSAPRGRAEQLDVGAAAAHGDVLLFLHADTRLVAVDTTAAADATATNATAAPTAEQGPLAALLARPHTVLGAFTFAFEPPAPATPPLRRALLRLFACNTRLRGLLAHTPYGDQAFFCRRAFFEAVGGFAPASFLEDVIFAERARRVGRVALLRDRAYTSPRRYLQRGPLRTMGANRLALREHRHGRALTDIARRYRQRLAR